MKKNNIKKIDLFIRETNTTLDKINDIFYEKDKTEINKMIKEFLENQRKTSGIF